MPRETRSSRSLKATPINALLMENQKAKERPSSTSSAPAASSVSHQNVGLPEIYDPNHKIGEVAKDSGTDYSQKFQNNTGDPTNFNGLQLPPISNIALSNGNARPIVKPAQIHSDCNIGKFTAAGENQANYGPFGADASANLAPPTATSTRLAAPTGSDPKTVTFSATVGEAGDALAPQRSGPNLLGELSSGTPILPGLEDSAQSSVSNKILAYENLAQFDLGQKSLNSGQISDKNPTPYSSSVFSEGTKKNMDQLTQDSLMMGTAAPQVTNPSNFLNFESNQGQSMSQVHKDKTTDYFHSATEEPNAPEVVSEKLTQTCPVGQAQQKLNILSQVEKGY